MLHPLHARAADMDRSNIADLAKVSPHVLDPARFALHLAAHLLARYAHISAAFVTVEQLRWARIGAGASGEGAGHKHAFWRDGSEKRFVEIEVARKSDGGGAIARVAGGLKDLLGALLAPFSHLLPKAGANCSPLSAQVDGIGIRKLCEGRIYDASRGGRPDLQYVHRFEIHVWGSGRAASERREGPRIWGAKPYQE